MIELIELPDCAKNKIKAYAKICYPNEMCGFIVNDDFVAVKNIAPNPKIAFEMCPIGVATAHKMGKVQAVVHSHTNGNKSPSKTDIISQAQLNLPWLIVVHDGVCCNDWFWFGDFGGVCTGADYRFGVHDCFAHARELFTIKQIELPNLPRDIDGGFDEYFNPYAKDNGFTLLKHDATLKPLDVFICAIGNRTPNHIGVYVGDGYISHHLKGFKPKVEPLHKWQDRIIRWYRHGG